MYIHNRHTYIQTDRQTYIQTDTHHGGMESRGMKKPLVKPATELITGDRRNAKVGKPLRTNISRAIHV